MMNDQAAELRKKLNSIHGKSAKTIAIVSGKGGVGKSNISMNFAVGLSQNGKKVLIFDMDIGMGNIHLLSGQGAEHSIVDFFEKEMDIEDLIIEGPGGISYILGGSGLGTLIEWGDIHLTRLVEGLEALHYKYDYMLFDMGAGATRESLDIIMSVEDIFIVTTPEPTAVTDAYSMMKYIYLRDAQKNFYLVCNRAESYAEGKETMSRLTNVMWQFLKKETAELGVLPEDKTVRTAVKQQTPFLIHYPNSAISRGMKKMIHRYVNDHAEGTMSAEKQGFIQKLRHFFFERQG